MGVREGLSEEVTLSRDPPGQERSRQREQKCGAPRLH